ncbi:uncharacterized protein LOC131608810 isoform X5 [Vicia villosa]|uniref:uncharacterized protein LOC131608810 isoform X5 n=1 Tax=Vicia villosa TaxID=3911 RepID=UPI00273C5B5B|nr:uncharacterized protein LOC131608810 isoform X5 [Vicia villosa]XP_058736344.1 uncharacterized protein LOC131608810 isoform X5 [Vicia villosa]XP_058736345.1 uncharacterized protein LOC131608810 isoform X5 [Vicia villosa]XP_058736346.1 uncharacterized protein LOC131608810 isoform X5 [Vicia villosa]XP_058736347.1 uncharacterized protein LOC131608810 isoform X5 [Vicia villosa]XP_058736348.1 uncharacterized protein LOC131608810 isoform X5 [Vicia villosa]
MERGRRARARVVVLSDFGRSPKRQYHALPLANQALLEVDIVAYGGPEPHTELLANPSIHIHLMKQWSTARQSLPKKQERERREKEEKWKEKFKEKKSLDLRRFFSKSTHLHHLQLVYQVPRRVRRKKFESPYVLCSFGMAKLPLWSLFLRSLFDLVLSILICTSCKYYAIV